jgi:hypothetical protein
MMTFCEAYKIDMPDDFPISEVTEFMVEARRVLKANEGGSPAWTEFAGASNLIGFRFRASADAWTEYRTSIVEYGDGKTHEQLFERERSLFLMFTAGVSCIESTTYALAAASSHPTVAGINFGPDEQRMCSPKKLALWLKPHQNLTPIDAALTRLLTSDEWNLWVDLRNRMTHRSDLPRRNFASVGAPPPITKPLNFAATSSTPAIDSDLADFDALHCWLASMLKEFLISGITVLRVA